MQRDEAAWMAKEEARLDEEERKGALEQEQADAELARTLMEEEERAAGVTGEGRVLPGGWR